MDLEFSISSLLASFVFGVIGFWLLKEGRNRTHFPLIFTGLGMMIYPYFVSNALLTWVIGFVLCGLAYKFWNE